MGTIIIWKQAILTLTGVFITTLTFLVAAETEKPYQVIDGQISQNAIEGWKTYNGGAVGAVMARAGKVLLRLISR